MVERLLPWFIAPRPKHPILAWLMATIGNSLTLMAYTASIVFAILLAWNLLG